MKIVSKTRLENLLTKYKVGIVQEHDRIVRVRPTDIDFSKDTITSDEFDKNRSHDIFINENKIIYTNSSSNEYRIVFENKDMAKEWYDRFILNNPLIKVFKRI